MTLNEQKILDILRELKAYEVVEIHKDQLGRADHFFIKRTQKVVLIGDKLAVDNKDVV